MLARRAAQAAIETELKTTVAGLLLHSQLALSSGDNSSPMAERMRVVADLAGNLRQQLSAPMPVRSERLPERLSDRPVDRAIDRSSDGMAA
jgi:hypothetical protein